MIDQMLDRRSERTRTALRGAFVALLLEHGYDALKIGMVAQRANVGRSTFYEHYRTKHELLQASIALPFAILADLVRPGAAGGAALTSLTELLRHFRDNQQVACVLLAWPTRPMLALTLTNLICERLPRHADSSAALPPVVLARLIAEAQLSLVDSWVQGRPYLALDAAAAALKQSAAALAAIDVTVQRAG